MIGCRTVLRNKFKAAGKLERKKARIVAKGFSQRSGDFHDTFVPVARISSLKTLMAAAIELDMQVAQIDITAAYLNGKMDTTVYGETGHASGDARKDHHNRELRRLMVKPKECYSH